MDKIPEPLKKKIYHYRDIYQIRDNLEEFDKINEEIGRLYDQREMFEGDTWRLITNLTNEYIREKRELKSLTIDSLKEEVEKYFKIINIEGKVGYSVLEDHTIPDELGTYFLEIEVTGKHHLDKINLLRHVIDNLLGQRNGVYAGGYTAPLNMDFCIPKYYFH